MDSLRSSLIRLAHSNPKLRGDILPLLKTGAENNPDLVKMDENCADALQSVIKALATIKRSKAYKSGDSKVVREAVKDLEKLRKSLEEIVGDNTPYQWDVIDLDK